MVLGSPEVVEGMGAGEMAGVVSPVALLAVKEGRLLRLLVRGAGL